MIAAILAFLFGFPVLALVLTIWVIRSRRKAQQQQSTPRPVEYPAE